VAVHALRWRLLAVRHEVAERVVQRLAEPDPVGGAPVPHAELNDAPRPLGLEKVQVATHELWGLDDEVRFRRQSDRGDEERNTVDIEPSVVVPGDPRHGKTLGAADQPGSRWMTVGRSIGLLTPHAA
jgi:hypothetical protein